MRSFALGLFLLVSTVAPAFAGGSSQTPLRLAPRFSSVHSLSPLALSSLSRLVTRDMQLSTIRRTPALQKLCGGSAPSPNDAWTQGIVLSANDRFFPLNAAPGSQAPAALTISSAILGRGISVIDPATKPSAIFVWPKGSVDPYVTADIIPPTAGLYMVSVNLRLFEAGEPLLYASTVTPMTPIDSPSDNRPTQWLGLVPVSASQVGKWIQIAIVRPANGSSLGSPATFTQLTIRRY